MSTGRLIAMLALVTCVATPVGAAGPKTRYERVLAQEQALRLQSPRPSPLSQIRRVVSTYETVARRYPTSGYADNALMQAAELSLSAHRLYGSDIDRDTAARMLKWLIDQYPHSSLLAKARQMLQRAKSTDKVARNVPAPAIRPAALSTVSMIGKSAPADTIAVPPPAVPAPAPPLTKSAVPTTVTLKQVTRTMFEDMVRVTLEFDGQVDYKQERLDGPARLYFDMKNTQAIPSLQDAVLSFEDESVRHIRLGRPRQDMTRLVIDLAGVDRYSIVQLQNPFRLTIDLQRTVPLLTPIALMNLPTVKTRRITTVAALAPRVRSADIPRDLDVARRIPPRPLPHPLADTPTPRVTPRPVAAEIAALSRPKPLVGRNLGFPITAPLASVHQGTNATAAVAAFLIPKPLVASRRGLPIETTSPRAPKSSAIAARMNVPPPVPAPLPNRPPAPPVLPAPTAPSTNTAGGFSLARQLGLGVARIVIDPGHGGHDPGALGSTKVIEKDIVLDVALRLEKLLLDEPGFEVVLTRRTDVFIPLEERTAIANRERADLFLSIHVNSSRNRQATGVETYYLNFASNPEAEAVAARENAGASQTMNHLPEIVKAIALNNKLDESRDFAHMVQEAMVGGLRRENTGTRDLGVKQAPFVVLIGAGMPSVLAEIAFLSNQQEGALLRTGAYRQKVADALFEAVKSYQRSLKSVGTVAAQIGPPDSKD